MSLLGNFGYIYLFSNFGYIYIYIYILPEDGPIGPKHIVITWIY